VKTKLTRVKGEVLVEALLVRRQALTKKAERVICNEAGNKKSRKLGERKNCKFFLWVQHANFYATL
jgi:hypothetical protein